MFSKKILEGLTLAREGYSLKDKMTIFLYFLSRIFRKVGKTKPSITIFNVTVKNDDGIFFCGNNISSVRSASTSTEKNLRKYFNLSRGTFIDIGATIGKYTIIMGKKLSKRGKVISIEPERKNFKILKKNIELNKLENVIPINCACSSTEGHRKFYLDAIGTGAHSFYKNKVISKKTIKITTKKLDNILSELTNFSDLNLNECLIKIDVEGAEADVLEGAKKILKKYHPKIILEAWDEKRLERVRKILKPFGYRITKIDEENYFIH